MDSNSKIPKPASFKKPQTSSTSSFDFSSFRSFQSNNMSDRVKSNLEMFDKKPLSELNFEFAKNRRAHSPDPVKSSFPEPTKLRRSKSISDIRPENFRGLKRPNLKLEILPAKRLKASGVSGIAKSSSFTNNQTQKKKTAIASMIKSESVAGIAKIIHNKPTGAVGGFKSKMEVKPAVSKTFGQSVKSSAQSTSAKFKSTANSQSTTNNPANKVKPAMKPAPYDYKARFLLLKEKFDVVKAENDNKQRKIDEIEKEVSEFSEKEHELESKISKLNEESSSKTKEIEKLTFDLNELQSKCANLITKNTALADSLSQSSIELADTKKKLLKLENISEQYEQVKQENSKLGKDLSLTAQNYHQSVDQLYLMNAERLALHNMVLDLRGNIRVFARVRPLLNDETDKETCTWAFPEETSLEISTDVIQGVVQKKTIKHEFSFDQVFDPNSEQEEIFDIVVPLIQSALDGFNVCIFAYGQTGSGKTYTMDGPPDQPGIIPRTVKLLFNTMESSKHVGWNYSISVSFLEIYNEVIYDLLSNENKNIEIRMADAKSKTEIYLSNITVEKVESALKLYELMKIARSNRATAATVGNERSSRSHAVTRIEITGIHSSRQEKITGSINLVDLAGSESPKTSTRMDETKNINRSLSELSNVILALVAKNEHVPYRNSKLTHLLMPSLGGNSKTLMFVNVSPLQENFSETVKSLRFASQVNSCKMAKARKNKQAASFSGSNVGK